jgi:DNA modification methylase
MFTLDPIKDVILVGDALKWLKRMAPKSVNCIVTSPPYWGLRDYQVKGQIGMEPSPEDYIANMVEIFRESRRVLSDKGVLWLNLGDSFWAKRSRTGVTWGTGKNAYRQMEKSARAGGKSHPIYKPKDLMMLPARVALALQADGWWLRQQVIWQKPDAMPSSVKDRPTTDYELVYLFSKSPRYYYNAKAIREPAQDWGWRNREDGKYTSEEPPINGPAHTGLDRGDFSEQGRNKRSVWKISTAAFKGGHFAVMPNELAEICIKAGCPEGGIVLDPFGGSGTTAAVATSLNRHYVLIELNPSYVQFAQERICEARNASPMHDTELPNGKTQYSLFGGGRAL